MKHNKKREEIDEKLIEKRKKNLRAGYYLIDLISAVLNERVPAKKPEDMTWEEVRLMAKKHSVQSIAYAGALQLAKEEDAAVMEKWLIKSDCCALQGRVQLAERARVYQRITEAGIRILPLKGCILKDLYPKQEYRQMADLDILVDDENMERAGKILEGMGYTAKHLGGDCHDCYEKKPWMSVELHRRMLPCSCDNEDKYQDIWERAMPMDGNDRIYRLTWEDFYLFMIDHFAKHFQGGGSGIRSVMDIHVFLESKANEMDRDCLKKKLKEYNLWEFEQKMERIAAKWFRQSDTDTDAEAEAYIITSGVYGTVGQWHENHLKKMAKKYHSMTLAKLRRLWEIIWLGPDSMKQLYPILEKYPFLGGFCRIHRIVKGLITKQDKIKTEFQRMKKV